MESDREYVPLDRRFKALTAEELEQQEILAMFGDSPMLSGIGWTELLEQSRVLLLAEAGSGKTTEMREAAGRLVASGKPAFVLPLEDLNSEGAVDILTGDNRRLFQAWKSDGVSTAWFFLDAVDELKLHLGSLDRALRRFARDVDGLLARTRVIVSSRPNDWNPIADMATLKLHFPIVQEQQDARVGADAFLGRLQHERQQRQSGSRSRDQPVRNDEPLAVILLPLTDKQIQVYARSEAGASEPDAFLTELELQHAQTFARRPADLGELLKNWEVRGSLGTRVQQHETNVTSKLSDKADRPDASFLTDKDAQTGAERLALALALMRRRTIRSPEDARQSVPGADSAMLNPAAVLSDLTPAARSALLRRGLFDPATYGRIRFHDRSVQEYLAAKRLHHLRRAGMARSALHRLLFAEAYEQRVVLPSMRPIAAWLALWDEDVKSQLIAREPETLLSMGDPEALAIEDRIRLVNAFASSYGSAGGRGVNVPIDAVRRVAHPDLDSTIRELWAKNRYFEDVSELLLELLWQSKSQGCKDICLEAALDAKQPPYHRVIAIRALVKCGALVESHQVAEQMVSDIAGWPARVIHGTVPDLYPVALKLDELLTLLRDVPEPRSTVSGFAWQAQQIAQAVPPLHADSIKLREWLSDIVWVEREKDVSIYDLKSKRSYLTKALATLCARQLNAGADPADASLARASVIANRFAPDRDIHGEEIIGLRKAIDQESQSREAAFWADVSIMRELEPGKDAWHQYYNALHDGVVNRLRSEDKSWLDAAYLQRADLDKAAIALHSLIVLWIQRDRPTDEAERLRSTSYESPVLSEIFSTATVTSPVAAKMQAWEKNEERRRAASAKAEVDHLAQWSAWREKVLADQNAALGEGELVGTLTRVYLWLQTGASDSVRAKVWDRSAVSQAFNNGFALLCESALQRFWRTFKIAKSSDDSEEDQNATNAWALAFCGVSVEARTKDWALHLTPEEARLATLLATGEVNGLAEWIVDLAGAFPDVVEDVLGTALEAEMSRLGLEIHIPMLQDIRYAALAVKRLLSARVYKALLACPASASSKEVAAPFAHVVDQLVEILFETRPPGEHRDLSKLCLQRNAESANEETSLQWLRAALTFDFCLGGEALEARLNASEPKEAERVLSAMFNRRNGIAVSSSDDDARAATLAMLVRTASRVVRIEDDQPHDGVYTPNERDHAETARGILFGSLLETKGPRAHAELLAMANEPLFAHMPDRLRLLARERVALAAEFPSLDEDAYRLFDQTGERPGVDRDSLMQLAESRLADLQHAIAHHDFSDRRTLRTIHEESEMQRTLAMRLDTARNGAYVVTREDEVADRKKTDIRLLATQGADRFVIEVKIADKRWTLGDFEHALEHQLLGQYLRHQNMRAGCLLLTYNGDRKYWRRGNHGANLDLPKLVDHLSALARKLELREEGRVRLAVFGLDLRDPPLLDAHR